MRHERLIEILFTLVLALLATRGAFAQALSCQISNDFNGTTQQSPGNYQVDVTPGATGTLGAVCNGGISSWFWSPGGQSTQTIQVTAPSFGSASYTLTGCIASVTGVCAPPVTITLIVVQPAPDCTLSASPNPATSGQTVTFTATCTPPAASIQYTDLSGVARVSTSTTFTDVAPVVTATQVRNVFYHGIGSNGEVGIEKELAVTINPAPVSPSSCTLTATPSTILLGQQTVLTAQCTAGDTPVQYVFTLPGGTQVTQATGTLANVPTSAGTLTYTVVASNAGGAAAAATATVVVQQPACTIAASQPNPVGKSTPVTLAATCNTPTSAVFQWSTPAGPIAGQTGASITVTPQATTTYTVTASIPSTQFPVTASGQYTVVVSPAVAISNIVAGVITGISGQPLSRALEVRVVDQSGVPVAGENVNWSVINPGSNPGSFAATTTGPTNAQGITSNTFTMGNDPGGRTLRACLVVLPTVCADFTVVPGATQIVAVAGSPLVGAPGRALRELAVQARDAAGNGVPGESVNWSVVNPGSNPGSFAANPTGPTNAQGITTNVFTMGSDPGGRTLRACLVSAPTACVDFVVRSLDAAVTRPATKIMSPMAEVAVQTPLTQIYNIRMRLEQLRLRRNPAVIEALKVSVAGHQLPSWSAFALAAKDGKPQRGGGAAADQDPFERLGAFVNGDVEIGRQSATGISSGYDLTTKGVTAGVDYRLPGDSVVGIAGGYMKADTDLAESGGNQNASGYSFSAYGSFVPAPGAYVDVIAHAGHNKYDTRRRELVDGGGTADYFSNTSGRQFAAAVTAGADINRGPVTLNPYLRVDYVDAKINGFSESGDAGSIAIKELNLKNTVVTAGGQVSYAMSTSWGVLMPNARLELQRRVQGDNRNVTALLVADGTISAVAPLESVDRNYGNMTIGASAVLPKGISGFVNIERLFGRESYSNTKYTLGVRLEF